MTRRTGLLFLLILALLGCGAKEPAQTKTYDMNGVVKALDPATKSATIQHEKIADWMEAMTMEFPVKPDSEFAKLHVGDAIRAKVVVSDLSYYVTAVNIVPK